MKLNGFNLGELAHNLPDTRIRLRFSRLDNAIGFSHADQLRELRRRAAASGLPCCGKNIPKMSFSPALSEGCLSSCEFADLYLYDFVTAEEAAEKIHLFDDDKYVLMSSKRIPVFFPAVEAAANAVRYRIEAENEFSKARLAEFLAASSWIYERVKASGKMQRFDIRSIYVGSEMSADSKTLILTLAFSQGANIRPESAVLSIFGQDMSIKLIERIDLLWKDSKGELNAF